MSFAEEKKLCDRDGVIKHEGLKLLDGRLVDRCRLTGCRCHGKKCPKFSSHIKPTNSLANAGLEKAYNEEMENANG